MGRTLRNPESGNMKRNLIVNYLPYFFEEQHLQDLFVNFGPLESVKIVRNECGKSKGFGFVKYVFPPDARRAIASVHGSVIFQKTIKVGFAGPRENTNLYVSGIPDFWTFDDFRSVFQRFGELIEIRFLEKDGQRRNCGFVRFNSFIDSSTAIEHLHNHIPAYSNRPLIVTREKKINSKRKRRSSKSREEGRPRSQSPKDYPTMPAADGDLSAERPPTCMDYAIHGAIPRQEDLSIPIGRGKTLFLRGIPLTFSKYEVMEFCSQYGKVDRIIMQTDKDKKSLGMFFVCFSTVQAAVLANHSLNGCKMMFNEVFTTIT